MNPEIKIEGLTPHQVRLADMIWAAQDTVQVAAIIALFGQEAKTVKELITAAVLDTVDQTELANHVLDQFRL
jgi:hypothetical protein